MSLISLSKKLESKKFFIFNLVLIGAIFGFSLAFLSFSCSTSAKTAAAQQNPLQIPQDALATAENLQSAFQTVADKVLPSVVEIKTETIVKNQIQNMPNFNGIPWDFFFGPRGGNNNGDEENNRTQPRERRSAGLGSGIIVRQTGDTYFVLTNNHVTADTAKLTVVDNDGDEYSAELVGSDERKDLALIKFDSKTKKHPPAVLGDSDTAKVGHWAIAVGTPLGFMSSVTMGIISALGRQGGPAGNINDFIQTDASINQGNSGGALVNIHGEVIGINTWIASNSGAGSVGLGFAIPINNAKRSIEDLISKGKVSSGWLGVSLTEIDNDIKTALGIAGKRGAFASMVFLDSPAAKGGIVPGDFITAVNGKEVINVTALTRAVSDIPAGDTATFTLIRDGKQQDVKVKIEERSNEVAADNGKLWPGLFVIPITEELRKDAELDKNTTGLYVAQVTDKSPAKIIGVQREDIITAINGVKVKDLPGFYKALREQTSKELYFEVKRGENTVETLRFKR